MTKFTPGPWTATAKRVTAPETEDRLALDVQINGGNRDDNKANARLIAAAPDMLVALRRAVLALAFAAESSPAMRDDYNAVSDAIAKATGAGQ